MAKPRKAFFCYEKHSTGWTGVVYYDESPIGKGVNGSRPETVVMKEFTTTDTEYFDEEGNPDFAKLRKNFALEVILPEPEEIIVDASTEATVETDFIVELKDSEVALADLNKMVTTNLSALYTVTMHYSAFVYGLRNRDIRVVPGKTGEFEELQIFVADASPCLIEDGPGRWLPFSEELFVEYRVKIDEYLGLSSFVHSHYFPANARSVFTE